MANTKKWLHLLSSGEELPGSQRKKSRRQPSIDQNNLEEWLKWLRGEVEVYTDRKRKYKEYERMDDKSLEISSALGMYASDATAIDWNMHTNLWIEARDRKIKAEGEALFDALDMPNMIWSIARNLAKYGDDFERPIFARDKNCDPVIGGGTNGIVQIRWANPKYIERIEDEYSKLKGFLDSDPWHHKVVKKMVKTGALDQKFNDARNVSKRRPWDLIHFRLVGKGRNMKYGGAMIEDVRAVWKYLDLITEVIMVTRLSRGPSRKVFYVDIGDRTPDEEAWDIIKFWKQMMNKDHWLNPQTGEFRSIHDPKSPSENLFWPVRGQKSASRIEELPGLTDVREMADVDLLWTRLFSGLKIPPEYFGYRIGGGGLTTPNNARTLTLQDMRYARTIKTLQVAILRGIHRMLDIHFSLLGWSEDSFKGKYNVMLSAVSTDEEFQRSELISSKLSQASQWADLVERLNANKEAVLKHVLTKVLNLTKTEAEEISEPPPPPPQEPQQGIPGQPPMGGYPESSENKELKKLLESVEDPEALRELISELSRGDDDLVRTYDNDPLPIQNPDDEEE